MTPSVACGSGDMNVEEIRKFPRESISFVLGLALLSGCLGGSNPTRAHGQADDEQGILLEPFSFQGTVLPQASDVDYTEHSIAVGDATLWVDVDFDVQADAGATVGFLDVIAPSGERVYVWRPGHHAIPRLMIEEAGTGTYLLRIVAAAGPEGQPIAPHDYVVMGNIASGAVPEPFDPPILADAMVANEGVVVAVIDTGVNPYHEAFREAPPTAATPIDALTGDLPRRADLSLDLDQEPALLADDAFWRGVEPHVLYRFEGTRLFGISMIDDRHFESYPLNPAYRDSYTILDDHGHGTATAATVLSQAPNATIVMVEIHSTMAWEGIARAIDWVTAQPWIDVVSVSMGNNLGIAGPHSSDGDPGRLLPEACLAAVRSGKVYVGSAGNDPTVQYADNADGPPWVIAVSGVDAQAKSRGVMMASTHDFVANYTVLAPRHDNASAYNWIQGTSFAAPQTAGAFAKAIHDIRAAVDHVGGLTVDGLLVDRGTMQLDNHDFREAFNRSAVYWDTTQYHPTDPTGNGPGHVVYGSGIPILPRPYLQMGWGYVDTAVAERVVGHLLGTTSVPEKPPDAIAYMALHHNLRTAYWG